jgi:hypothetical protein
MATFILGLDGDQGSEPFELTRAFIRDNPDVWPHVNLPVPYGATPLYDTLLESGRLLRGMPLVAYHQPYLTFRLRHYDPLDFYEQLLTVIEAASSLPMLARRLGAARSLLERRRLAVQTLRTRQVPPVLRRLVAALRDDRALRAFHDGAEVPLPEIYAELYRRRLGRFIELVPLAESRPLLDPVPTNGQVAVELAEVAPSRQRPRQYGPRRRVPVAARSGEPGEGP